MWYANGQEDSFTPMRESRVLRLSEMVRQAFACLDERTCRRQTLANSVDSLRLKAEFFTADYFCIFRGAPYTPGSLPVP